jgi:hypothetical protein
MPPYPNLVSDSTLVQDTIDLLTDAGGRAAASEIVDAVFKISHIDDELAGLLVADLIRNDRRFKIIENNTIELQRDNWDTRLLKDLDFVVVDVEATGAKTPPNRLIELGAYRIRGGRIVISLCNSSIRRFPSLASLFLSPEFRTIWFDKRRCLLKLLPSGSISLAIQCWSHTTHLLIPTSLITKSRVSTRDTGWSILIYVPSDCLAACCLMFETTGSIQLRIISQSRLSVGIELEATPLQLLKSFVTAYEARRRTRSERPRDRTNISVSRD